MRVSVQGQQSVIAFPVLRSAQDVCHERVSIELAEFVEHRFIPEYAKQRRVAVRAHLRAILKHILSPERIDRAFHADRRRHGSRTKLTHIAGWPYMDAAPLSEITPEAIQALLSAAINRGYSPQTVNHIRTVLGLVFSHAMLCGDHRGINPVSEIAALPIARKQVFTLTLTEVKSAMERMRYPERHMALLALLTDMSVVEICGLQWKHVNLSSEYQILDEEQLPPRTLAVRMQSYRGEYCTVKERRNRLIRLRQPLYSVFLELAFRLDSRGEEDFVLSSRTGSRIHPDNIAGRRLKAIGRDLSLPTISWKVFQQTGITLRKQFGKEACKQIERVLPVIHRSFPKRWSEIQAAADTALPATLPPSCPLA